MLLVRFGDAKYPITNMFDIDGEETGDPELATSVVADMQNGKWLACEVRAGDIEQQKSN